MSAGWSIYLAGVITVLAFLLSRRTGDAYTDQPILGCLFAALLWPLLLVILACEWFIEGWD